MKTAIVKLKSASPYSQSKFVMSEKMDKESSADFEERTWKERAHITNNGHVFIPPMQFKNAIAAAAKYLSIQIPGKGKATYTKHFEAGILITDGIVLPEKLETIKAETVMCSSDGTRGGSKKVLKTFPIIYDWEGDLTVYVLDETITEKVFKKHVEEAGKLIGIGRWRPRNNGLYGRFDVLGIEWE